MKKILLCLIFSLLVLTLKAQSAKDLELRKLKKLFRTSISRADFKDTNTVYMFAYKVEVRKTKSGNVQVESINSSDSSSKLIYKNTDFIKEVNFSVFMGDRKHCTFVFPVVIFLENYEGKHPGMIKVSEMVDKFLPYLYLTGSGVDPTYDYIYIPATIMLTSTVESI